MSKIEVNTVAPQCGTTLTLGESGDTVTLGTGASQSGFGRTGTVDWQTSSIKTSTFTAANGEGYFADTSSGGFTMNLPAGSAGNIVSVVDYTNTFQNNGLTISPNGSQKIGGANASVTLSTEGQSITLVYVDDTEGWKNVQDSTSNVVGNPNLVATGGTITTSGNCKIHTFTGPGTFTVTNLSSTADNNTVSYLVLAGGGGGGGSKGSTGAGGGSGAGAGGFRELKSPTTPYTASPLDGYATPGNRVTVTAQAYPITVGAGGSGGPGTAVPNIPGNNGTNGSVSTFSTISSAGGGNGRAGPCASQNGEPGGSGSGASGGSPTCRVGGSGNTPPVTPPQGQNGGNAPSSAYTGAGGGGAGAVGSNAPPSPSGGPFAGGAGVASSITASPVTRAAGGFGKDNNDNTAGPNRSANTGDGGPGANGNPGTDRSGGNGGSGVVIIRYKYQ